MHITDIINAIADYRSKKNLFSLSSDLMLDLMEFEHNILLKLLPGTESASLESDGIELISLRPTVPALIAKPKDAADDYRLNMTELFDLATIVSQNTDDDLLAKYYSLTLMAQIESEIPGIKHLMQLTQFDVEERTWLRHLSLADPHGAQLIDIAAVLNGKEQGLLAIKVWKLLNKPLGGLERLAHYDLSQLNYIHQVLKFIGEDLSFEQIHKLSERVETNQVAAHKFIIWNRLPNYVRTLNVLINHTVGKLEYIADIISFFKANPPALSEAQVRSLFTIEESELGHGFKLFLSLPIDLHHSKSFFKLASLSLKANDFRIIKALLDKKVLYSCDDITSVLDKISLRTPDQYNKALKIFSGLGVDLQKSEVLMSLLDCADLATIQDPFVTLLFEGINQSKELQFLLNNHFYLRGIALSIEAGISLDTIAKEGIYLFNQHTDRNTGAVNSIKDKLLALVKKPEGIEGIYRVMKTHGMTSKEEVMIHFLKLLICESKDKPYIFDSTVAALQAPAMMGSIFHKGDNLPQARKKVIACLRELDIDASREVLHIVESDASTYLGRY